MTSAIKSELIFTSALSSGRVPARAERRMDRQLVQSVRANCTGGQSCPRAATVAALFVHPREAPEHGCGGCGGSE
jgi:hypothetical protein